MLFIIQEQVLTDYMYIHHPRSKKYGFIVYSSAYFPVQFFISMIACKLFMIF